MRAWHWGAAAMALAGFAAPALGQTTTVAQAREQLVRAERVERAAERALERWVSTELQTFRSEAEFDAYRAAAERLEAARDDVDTARYNVHWTAQRAARGTGGGGGGGGGGGKGQSVSDGAQPAEPCPPEDKDCLTVAVQQNESQESVIVTGSRIQAAPNVTNVQEAGVDEGDVVKQIGRYLLILQDGRIFVTDMQGGAGRDRLVLTDRADVYRHSSEDAWYDELNVFEDRVIVTGYSYRRDASEIAVFRLSPEGRLTRDGVFQIKSSDYYSQNNYSSRIVGDRLILYTPLPIGELEGSGEWPRLRRVPLTNADGEDELEEEAEAAFQAGVPLLTPGRLYQPLSVNAGSMVHMVTTCTLGARTGPGIGCESRGFIGAWGREFYVAGDEAYLWTRESGRFLGNEEDPEQCAPGAQTARADAPRAIVYRIGLTDGSAGVAGANGAPFNQLALDAGEGRFRALVAWPSVRCEANKGLTMSYMNAPQTVFSRRLRPVPDSAFTTMPDIGATMIENRFTDRFLVFGGRNQQRVSDEPEQAGIIGGGHAVIVPIDRPRDARTIWLPHRVWRAEQAGNNAILTGYSDATGLDISLIDLSGATPRLATTMQLDGRFESEGRSHAFNSAVNEDGTGIAGLPTVLRVGDADRTMWRTSSSDVSFIALEPGGGLRSLGPLETRAEGERDYERESADPTVYSCQVSCIDWYGNSRPLFVGNRVFALTATELVEGRVANGRISEVQRIDLTKELPPHMRLVVPAADDGAAGTKPGE